MKNYLAITRINANLTPNAILGDMTLEPTCMSDESQSSSYVTCMNQKLNQP